MLSTDRHGKSTDRDLPTLVPCHYVGGRIGNRHAGAIVSRAACTARTALDSTAETFDARVSQMTLYETSHEFAAFTNFSLLPVPPGPGGGEGGHWGKEELSDGASSSLVKRCASRSMHRPSGAPFSGRVVPSLMLLYKRDCRSDLIGTIAIVYIYSEGVHGAASDPVA